MSIFQFQPHTFAIPDLVIKSPGFADKVDTHWKLPAPEVESIDDIGADIKETQSYLENEYFDECHKNNQEKFDTRFARKGHSY